MQRKRKGGALNGRLRVLLPWFFIPWFILVGVQGSLAATWYVDGSVVASGDGTSWATAFKTVQEGVTASSDDDEIWVTGGIYSLSSTITVDRAVDIYGGFDGTETERQQRDWCTNVTVIDGESSVRCLSVSADATIDGLTVQNGHTGTGGYGGGIYVGNASLTITACIISDNDAGAYGGGIYCSGSTMLITNCLFVDNRSDAGGGAIANYDSGTTVTNCTFYGNYAPLGGAVRNHDSSPVITNCILWNNWNTELFDYGSSSATVRYCDIDQGGYEGSDGNILEDPLFVDPENGNFHLRAASPCVDAGMCGYWMVVPPDSIYVRIAPYFDYEGDPRPMGMATTGCDIGFDEYVGPPYRPLPDFDGDGMTDIAVYHAASGLWFIRQSSDASTFYLGYGGSAYVPVPGDYDGDGMTDVAVYHAASGLWYMRYSSNGTTHYVGYGGSAYTPVPGDYDGDGITDVAVYHAASGLWFYLQSSDGSDQYVGYGGAAYSPVAADYDGDGITDIAVYHASSGLWHVRKSSDDTTVYLAYGGTAYVPVPGYYDSDGLADIAVYHQASGLWYVHRSSDGSTFALGYGGAAYEPVPGDYDGDGRTDIAVYHAASGLWYMRYSSDASTHYVAYGGTDYTPVNLDYLLW